MDRSADIVLLEKSMADMNIENPGIIEKSVLYINDSNNSSYNGSISIDSTVLANSGKWLDFSEGVLQVPLTIAMQSDKDITASINAFCVGLKSGSFQLIDSIQADYNNKNVIQSQSYTNFHTSYRVLSSWSQDDVKKYGDLTLIIPDSDASSVLSSAASFDGSGVCNNRPEFISVNYAASGTKDNYNEGFRKRLENTANYATGNAGITTSAEQMNQSGFNYFTDNGGTAAARIYYWYVSCTIRLKDVSDFFEKLPLLRGGQLRLTINYNSSRIVLNSTAADDKMSVASNIQLSGRTCPFMVASGEVTQPMSLLLDNAADQFITVESGIKTTSLGGSNPLSAVRLYVPAFRLSPDLEVKYLSEFPTKMVEYNDIYQYTITSVNGGSTFNQLLTNAIVNPQKLVIVPMFTKAANTGNIEQFQNCFDSAPFTTAPRANIRQLQVQISGQNVFNEAVNYTWEQYQYEVSKSGIEGGLVSGLSSGLLSKKGFENNYSYIVIDLSRREASQDIVPKSIQISGVNSSSFAVTYYCFVEYKRSAEFRLSDGAIIG